MLLEYWRKNKTLIQIHGHRGYYGYFYIDRLCPELGKVSLRQPETNIEMTIGVDQIVGISKFYTRDDVEDMVENAPQLVIM